MAQTTVSDLNSLFNFILDRATFAAREQSIMPALVQSRDGQGWADRKLSSRPAVTMATVAEGTDYASPTTFGRVAGATISPVEKIAQFDLTDRAMETDPDGHVADAIVEFGAAGATAVDTDLLALFTSFSAGLGAAGAAVTLAQLGGAIATLSAANVRQYGPINAVMHPYHWHDLWVELGQPVATKAALGDAMNQALRDYHVADLIGARIWTSSNIAVDGSDDAISGVFTRRALMLDTRRQPRIEAERNASARSTELNFTIGYGVGVDLNAAGVKITGDATAPA